MWKKKIKKIRNKGYMSIEASLIVSFILLTTFLMILGLLFTYERGHVFSKECERLYTIPIKNIRDKTVADYLNSEDYSKGIVYGELSSMGSYSSHKAKVSSSLIVREEKKISCKREIDQCSNRLRRWQLYDDIAED